MLSTTTGAHRDGRAPGKERCSIEEIPEGFTLAGAKPKDKAKVEPQRPPEMTSVCKEIPQPSSILYRVLSEFPGLDKEVVTEVMSWAEYEGTLHPTEVSHLLSQMAGVNMTLIRWLVSRAN